MKFVAWLVVLLAMLLALVFGLLSLGTFASLVRDVPLWLRSVGSLETTLAQNTGAVSVHPFMRALVLALVASLMSGLAAYFKPRRLP